jgi:hypothetical protein
LQLPPLPVIALNAVLTAPMTGQYALVNAMEIRTVKKVAMISKEDAYQDALQLINCLPVNFLIISRVSLE